MSELSKIIDSLEVKFFKLSKKIENLEQLNESLSSELSALKQNAQQENKQITSLKHELESLKITNSLLGSEEYKKETKLKINSLIREIDYCIAQLSE
jgi:chromosome segregation ATPase